jgi:hypothetical protein
MLSTYGANLYASVIVGLASPPTSFYLALLDTAPDVNDSGTDIAVYEPDAVEYVRVLIDTGSPDWANPIGGISLYQTAITYNPVTSWGTLTSYALCTAITAGETIMLGSLGGSITAGGGSTLTVPAGSLSIGIA